MSFINFSKSFLLLNSKKVPTHELDNATPNTNTIVESDTINVADDLISGTSTISPVDTSILETSTINTVDASILETSTNNTVDNSIIVETDTSNNIDSNFDEAIKLVLSEKNPDLKNAEAWNQLIIECADKGRSKMSIILFNEMKRLSMLPSQKSYTAIEHVNLLLATCQKAYNFNVALETYDNLIRSGRLKPNKETYLRILNICSANSSKQPETTYELATDVWNKLVKHDDQQSKEANDAVIVDNELVSGVISVFKDTKHPHHAFDIIDNTYGFGKVSTPSAEDKESSESTKEDLSTSTIASNKPALILPITNDVLVSIFGLCFKVRQYNLGIEYYNQVMTKYPNFSLDINAYNSVITLYNLTYQYKKTLEAYHSQFKKGGMVQNTTTFEYLMTACQSLRDLSTAKEVLENAVENQVMLKTFGLTRLFRLILEQARTTENYNDICWLLEKIDKTVDIDFDKEKKGFILIKYMDDAIFLRTLSSAYEIALEEVKDLSEEKRVQWIEDKKYFDHKADRLLETTSKYSKQNSMHEDDLRMRKIYQGRWKTQDDESWPNTSSYMRNRPPTRYNPNKSFGRPPSPELSFDSSPSTGSYGNFRGQHNRGRPGGYRGVSRNYRNVGYRGPNYSNG
ncbi:3318_t:CDS:2 [Entrophospora sp. SA101]|nr:3305_t:CDS:2 [Entrophospora sp. SA101]CAJ0911837.1 3318_t:CDS:2 [Entrophospora sp. SA101]